MTDSINDIIKSIGYVALCLSICIFLTIKFLKYLLARKKFRFNVEVSQNNTLTPSTPTNLTSSTSTPMLKRSFTP